MQFMHRANTVTPARHSNGHSCSGRRITEWYEAVGTVRPRTETRIESQVTAQVMDVKVRSGSKVNRGDVLVTLDSRKFRSRLDQAKQGLKSAEAGEKQAEQAAAAAQAAYDQAESNYQRTRTYYESKAATAQEIERAEAAFLQAEAELARAKESIIGAAAGIRQAVEVVREAEIAMGYTRITAPEAGEVIKRMVQPGDLALPGKPLLALQTEGTHRLEAQVREGLISRLTRGDVLTVELTAVNRLAEAVIEEIVPYADPQSRTFLVKAGLPAMPGLYPGMFGKLRVPADTHEVVTIPAAALRTVGQLALISVKENDHWVRRYIKTGRSFDDRLEVLAGLDGGETIGVY
jgi:HlyD family secretion protein